MFTVIVLLLLLTCYILFIYPKRNTCSRQEKFFAAKPIKCRPSFRRAGDKSRSKNHSLCGSGLQWGLAHKGSHPGELPGAYNIVKEKK